MWAKDYEKSATNQKVFSQQAPEAVDEFAFCGGRGDFVDTALSVLWKYLTRRFGAYAAEKWLMVYWSPNQGT